MKSMDDSFQAAMRDSAFVEARYRHILDLLPDAIVMANRSGLIVFSNIQAQQLFGYAGGELHGQPLETLLPERMRTAHVGHRTRFAEQPRTRPMGAGLELFGRRRDGSEFPVEISLSPLQTEEGMLMTSAIRDITERKRFEQALQEKNIELAKANLAKDRFLASMSHELRTPLNAVIGFSGILLMKLPGPLNAEQERQLRTIKTNAAHLLALINDILDLARIEAGKVELSLESIDCIKVVEEVANSLRPMAEGKDLVFEVRMPVASLFLRTDRRALSQILINLANNAIKFTERGQVRLEVTGKADAAGVDFSVIDTGPGIRPEDLEKLFDAFVQGSQSRQSGIEGTGLGLHLSRKLAGLLGGELSCRSEFGHGSTFTLHLPAD